MAPARPSNRQIIAPDRNGRFDLYVDDPDGLVYLDSYHTLAEATAKNPDAKVIPGIWDAPVIDPADPSTQRYWDDEAGMFTSEGNWP